MTCVDPDRSRINEHTIQVRLVVPWLNSRIGRWCRSTVFKTKLCVCGAYLPSFLLPSTLLSLLLSFLLSKLPSTFPSIFHFIHLWILASFLLPSSLFIHPSFLLPFLSFSIIYLFTHPSFQPSFLPTSVLLFFTSSHLHILLCILLSILLSPYSIYPSIFISSHPSSFLPSILCIFPPSLLFSLLFIFSPFHLLFHLLSFPSSIHHLFLLFIHQFCVASMCIYLFL